MPADNSINDTPERRGKVVVMGTGGWVVLPARIEMYADPIVTRTGYPVMCVQSPGNYADGSLVEGDLAPLNRLRKKTGKNHYNMNCQLALIYIQAINVLEEILDVDDVKAVAAANANPGHDTITFSPGLGLSAAIDITLAAELDVTGDLTIIGPGADLVTISGNDTYRIFDLADGTNVRLVGLTLTDGSATGPGGAIRSFSVSTTDLTRSFEYDARGNLVRKIDRNGRVLDGCMSGIVGFNNRMPFPTPWSYGLSAGCTAYACEAHAGLLISCCGEKSE